MGVAEGVMATRGYALINESLDGRLWPDLDLVVSVMEHLRTNLRSLEPRIPPEWEIDLLAGVTSHNYKHGPTPLLGLHEPPHLPAERMPDPLDLCATIESWIAGKTDDELRAIGSATVAPTWKELLASRVYPAR